MNYRHAFHAGNFADVFKHAILTLLLRALHGKETPFCYLETHAGAGRYDLAGAEAQKSGEYHNGVERLWDDATPPAPLADWLAAVRAANPDRRLRFYPGSPRIALSLLRAQDRMLLCELDADAAARLAAEFAGDRRAEIHRRDGFEALAALLPPTERRGLVLMDPAYEGRDEYARAADALVRAHRRWASGMYALWYPIKDGRDVAGLHQRLAAAGLRKLLLAELAVFPEDTAFRLNGSGMVLLNPPWKIDEILTGLLPRLLERLRQGGAGRATVRWLVPE
jgi:23S rRNA (adenine2030-N6)-methyltransferase